MSDFKSWEEWEKACSPSTRRANPVAAKAGRTRHQKGMGHEFREGDATARTAGQAGGRARARNRAERLRREALSKTGDLAPGAPEE